MPKENFELEVFRRKVLDELTSLREEILKIQVEADQIAWGISELQDELVDFYEKSEEDALDDERTDPEEEEE